MRQNDSDERALRDLVRRYADQAPDTSPPVVSDARRRPSWLTASLVVGVIAIAVGSGFVASTVLNTRGPSALGPGATVAPTQSASNNETAPLESGTASPSAASVTPTTHPPASADASASGQPAPSPSMDEDASLRSMRALWEAQGLACETSENPSPDVVPGVYLTCVGQTATADASVRVYLDTTGRVGDISMVALAPDGASLSRADQHLVATMFGLAPVPGQTAVSVRNWILESIEDPACEGTYCTLDADATTVLMQTGERGSFIVEIQYHDVGAP